MVCRYILLLAMILALPWRSIARDTRLAADTTVIATDQTEAFLAGFSFTAYLAETELHDVRALESQRRQLEGNGIDGDRFLEAVFHRFLEESALNLDDRETVRYHLYLGELLANSRQYLADSIYIYMVGSDMVFSNLAELIMERLDAGTLDKEDFHIRYVIARLGDNQYHVDIPVGQWRKLWIYIREGRWDYVIFRLTTSYRKELAALILMTMALFGTGVYWWRKKKRIEA